jgi:hypothetical protein
MVSFLRSGERDGFGARAQTQDLHQGYIDDE